MTEQKQPSVVEQPGLIERWKEHHTAHHEEHLLHERNKAYERAQREYEGQLRAWQDQDAVLRESLSTAVEYYGVGQSQLDDGWVLEKGERGFATVADAALIELRRAQGHYVAGYQGMSFRIAKGVSYRVGGARGHYVPGPEGPTVIDEGDVLITDQRVVFRGTKQSREWAFSKLLGFSTSPDRHWMALQV